MKIQQLLESSEGHPLYRGMGEPGQDLTGQEFSNQPRNSITSRNNAMSLFDNFAMKYLPQLRGTAPRSNCIILTGMENHARRFGANVYRMEIVDHTTPFTWCMEDFNEISGFNRLLDVLDLTSHKARIVQFGDYLENLDGAVLNSREMREFWKKHSRQEEMLPSEWVRNWFNTAFDHHEFGVAQTIDQIPQDAGEVWFQGTVRAVEKVA